MLRITQLYQDKITHRFYINIDPMDSGNGLETECTKAFAKDLIENFGLTSYHGEKYIHYQLPE
jgi:hypothetical protein